MTSAERGGSAQPSLLPAPARNDAETLLEMRRASRTRPDRNSSPARRRRVGRRPVAASAVAASRTSRPPDTRHQLTQRERGAFPHSEEVGERPREPGPARAYGPGRSPHRRGVGNTLPGLQRPAGSNAQRSRCIVSRSFGPNIFGIAPFLSTPTPCSPVIEPPWARQTSRISRASVAACSACPGMAAS